ncbi:YtxH domain-containing protein [Clostridium sp. DSM 100503]|uniref:YtxH domain-containing protein n=1 Tax=Clostridium sp. DSM 100503 TaxID=2963282 RepID=UPI00214A28CB|nr:YtxH domain-containing protein [Clostridium sp. DSM 100503]MCR1952210.1 YtxH domain-containing protein [Clostridium sp. DSM 100503]
MNLYDLIEKKKRKKRKKVIKATALSTIAGGAVGVLSGLLLAPKSGKETRQDIKEKIDDFKNSTVERKENFKRNISESKNKIKDYLKEKNKELDIEDNIYNRTEEKNICEEIE